MNNRFDELAKGLAQSVTRRQALKRFSVGLAGMALACFGLANKAEAAKCIKTGFPCTTNPECCSGICLWYGVCGCKTRADCGKGSPCVNGTCLV
jgi:hypothetical protein